MTMFPPRKAKRRSKNMTSIQRKRLCEENRAHPAMSHEQIALWAQKAFHLDRVPTQPTISNILKRSDELIAMDDTTKLKAKRFRSVGFPCLDEALMLWIVQKQANRVAIKGDIIKQKPVGLQKKLILAPIQSVLRLVMAGLRDLKKTLPEENPNAW